MLGQAQLYQLPVGLALAGIPRAPRKQVVCRTSEGCQTRDELAAM